MPELFLPLAIGIVVGLLLSAALIWWASNYKPELF